MLIAKGYAPLFFLADGSERRGPRGSALLHDESGESWPYASGLVMPFSRRGADDCEDDLAQRYFGDDYVVRCATVALPPRALEEWSEVGEVASAEYRREGSEHAGYYEHDFGHAEHSGLFSFFKKSPGKLPLLYARRGALRIELGSGAVWNWRGIVSP